MTDLGELSVRDLLRLHAGVIEELRARAALVPHAQVLEHSTYQEHANGWRFMLRDEVGGWPGVQDVTEELRRAETLI